MRTVRIADRTLKETKQSGRNLGFKDRLEIARHLDSLHVDVIEIPAIESAKTDALLISTIASFAKTSVLSADAGITAESAGQAWAAVRNAAKPRLSVSLPVSPAGMEYLSHKKAPQMLELIRGQVAACAALCGDVEFTAEDAPHAEPEFLSAALGAALEAGAGTITVSDGDGTLLPEQFAAFVSGLPSAVPALGDRVLGVCCHDRYGMAAAASLLAAERCAGEVKVSCGGDSAPQLAVLGQVLRDRGESVGLSCGLKVTELIRTAKQIDRIACTRMSEASAFEHSVAAPQQVSGIALTPDESESAVLAAVKRLGYDLSPEDSAKVFEAFRRLAAQKKQVTARELDVIVASEALQVPPTYKLVSYVINSGNMMSATAHVRLEKSGRTLEGFCLGDGPIDASFLAIEQITGHHYELDDFQIQAVTEGREAMGNTLVKLISGGRSYSGEGLSTDIIGASILAYLSALNKITWEEA